jgi:hypothetical protein
VYKNIQIYSENLVVEGMRYMLTSSCHLLVGHMLHLKKLKVHLVDISLEFTNKMVDVIKVILISYFFSILKNFSSMVLPLISKLLPESTPKSYVNLTSTPYSGNFISHAPSHCRLWSQ